MIKFKKKNKWKLRLSKKGRKTENEKLILEKKGKRLIIQHWLTEV